MISAFSNSWRVPELRSRILFTLIMIVVVRLGVYIPLPGIDTGVVGRWIEWKSSPENAGSGGGTLGAMFNIFSGGGLANLGIFALGIMPYISASIMMQILQAIVPKLAKLAREDGGRQKITQYTRFATIIIATVQGYMLARSLQNPESIFFLEGISQHGVLVPGDPGIGWELLTTLTLVAGALFIMWIGDQITDRGIGNGVSLVITVNIISALPGALVIAWQTFVTGETSGVGGPLKLVFLIAFLLFVIAATIAITQAQRRIAVQYAKRVVGRKMLGGQTQYLPLKVNYAGVMPIIFATAILALPAFLLTTVFKGASWSNSFALALAPGSIWYYFLAGGMIFFFSYFWVATMFQPQQISEDLKKQGGYIPGVRPGAPTAKFLDDTMSRLTFAGSIFLTIIFILPYIITQSLNLNFLVTQFFGGTSLLIIVGVLLDFMRQVETHLLQRNYDGFLRKGKMKGRYDKLQQQQQGDSGTSGVMILLVMAILIVLGIVAYNLNR